MCLSSVLAWAMVSIFNYQIPIAIFTHVKGQADERCGMHLCVVPDHHEPKPLSKRQNTQNTHRPVGLTGLELVNKLLNPNCLVPHCLWTFPSSLAKVTRFLLMTHVAHEVQPCSEQDPGNQDQIPHWYCNTCLSGYLIIRSHIICNSEPNMGHYQELVKTTAY